MPRPRRLDVTGIPMHVVHRGINRARIFLDDADRKAYLRWLTASAREYGASVHAWCLMANHVHLLVTPERPGAVSRTMCHLGRHYVPWFNRRRTRTGTLFQGRFHSSLVESEHYLFRCHRYVELNPVRAGIVHAPDGYRWSSYGTNALGRPSILVTPHEHYVELGPHPLARQAAYRALFEEILTEAELADIRRATSGNHVLGGDHFKRDVEARTGRTLGPGRRGRPKRG